MPESGVQASSSRLFSMHRCEVPPALIWLNFFPAFFSIRLPRSISDEIRLLLRGFPLLKIAMWHSTAETLFKIESFFEIQYISCRDKKKVLSRRSRSSLRKKILESFLAIWNKSSHSSTYSPWDSQTLGQSFFFRSWESQPSTYGLEFFRESMRSYDFGVSRTILTKYADRPLLEFKCILNAITSRVVVIGRDARISAHRSATPNHCFTFTPSREFCPKCIIAKRWKTQSATQSSNSPIVVELPERVWVNPKTRMKSCLERFGRALRAPMGEEGGGGNEWEDRKWILWGGGEEEREQAPLDTWGKGIFMHPALMSFQTGYHYVSRPFLFRELALEFVVRDRLLRLLKANRCAMVAGCAREANHTLMYPIV